MSSPKITLYTNRGCPWAHRAHIALKEVGVEYEEVTIDLTVPREPWYLEVNHVRDTNWNFGKSPSSPCLYPTYMLTQYLCLQRGLVPSLKYNGNIIIESGIVAQFIADAFPSHLSPPSGPAENALYRAQQAVFIDAFMSKVVPNLFTSLRAGSDAERDAAAQAALVAIQKEVEPLLASTEGKGPFFGGSDKLTLAEVQTGSFILRLLAFSKPEHGLVSAKFPSLLEQTPRFKRWAEATAAHESVNFIFDEKDVADRMRAKFAPKV
ncbi:hypothetical protein N7532_005730 [Penicillium argentinense]|uniref:Glutathione S-transferase n=1 Tax=Penicillium argentinense TaxID=1131581 RepID=A0A9W9KA40_9EURO|nr:uncharacterized protein N7532_005730 [Penicillium argentinense]KAJ5098729.1 hypothetical protein N7532_005730 [Penicillium argentinense]